MKSGNDAKNILIIDDESLIAQMIADFCQAFGFNTKVLFSGEEAMDVVKSYHPDVITLDLIMPEVSGLELLERLKLDQETKHIPVIVISALANSESAEEVLRLSQGFLAKPLKMDALEQKIETVLSVI